MLLTRLPVARLARHCAPSDFARCVWAFPIVGLVIGGLGGCVYALAHGLGAAPLLAAAWTLAAMTLATGALHEDGLADTLDGFGGGAAPTQKLAIMRDSRIGSYGALGLLLSLVARAAAIAAIDDPARVAQALVAGAMLGRAAMLIPIQMLEPARANGLGVLMAKPRPLNLILASALAMAGLLLNEPFVPALAALLLGLGAALSVTKLADWQIGGQTGDVLGACEVITECVVLSAFSSALRL